MGQITLGYFVGLLFLFVILFSLGDRIMCLYKSWGTLRGQI